MLWSDLLQEEYRPLTKVERAETKRALMAKFDSYHRFSEYASAEDAEYAIDDDLLFDDIAYAWATRLGVIIE